MDTYTGGDHSVVEVVTPEVQLKITSKLQEIFGDDDVSVLTDYICHMVNHNQPKEHIINELKEFLSDEASQFGTWVFQLVEGSFSKDHPAVSGGVPAAGSESATDRKPLPVADSHRGSGHSTQNKDSLDFAISNAIRSKPGPGRSKHYQQGGGGSMYKGGYSANAHDFSSGPVMGNTRLPRVNYRNAPYTRSNSFSQSGSHPHGVSGQPCNVSSAASSSVHGKIKVRCKNWPSCDKGDHCFYIHPSEACKSWPLCSYGPGCFFIHPTVPCRFGLACYNTLCNYTHPNGWDPNHVEAPVFKYGGYKNSSLIISNSSGRLPHTTDHSKPGSNANPGSDPNPDPSSNPNPSNDSNPSEPNNMDSRNSHPVSVDLSQANTEVPCYDTSQL